jgi:hypothetical protein
VWTLSNTVALYCLQQLTELTATAQQQQFTAVHKAAMAATGRPASYCLASAGANKKQQRQQWQLTAVHKAAMAATGNLPAIDLASAGAQKKQQQQITAVHKAAMAATGRPASYCLASAGANKKNSNSRSQQFTRLPWLQQAGLPAIAWLVQGPKKKQQQQITAVHKAAMAATGRL